MPAVGGSIESVTIRGRVFPVAADADANIDLGGFTNEVQPNGNKTSRLIKTAKPWGIDGVSVEIDDNRADLEFLQEVANEKEFEPITLTMASGKVYQGNGQLTGDIKKSTQNATAAITIMGQGEASQQ